MDDAELVQFLVQVGLDPRDILDDQPEYGVRITVAGVKKLLAKAPDDSGSFDVRAMLRRLCLLS